MGATNGWRKLQNDYTLVQNAAYTQQATATCAPGTSWIPDNVATIPANFTVDERVTPFPNSTTNAKMRHQYLFLKNELDVELNQLNGNTTITHGICAGQPITTLAFEKAAGGAVKHNDANGRGEDASQTDNGIVADEMGMVGRRWGRVPSSRFTHPDSPGSQTAEGIACHPPVLNPGSEFERISAEILEGAVFNHSAGGVLQSQGSGHWNGGLWRN